MNNVKPIYVQYAKAADEARKRRNFQTLNKCAKNLYNHFVHYPTDYDKMEEPIVVGSVFATSLGFQEQDEDIQEVKAENAVFCLFGGLQVDETDKNISAAYLFLVFSVFRKHLWQRIMRLFGAAELGVNMPSMTFFPLPSDVQSFIIKERLTTNALFDSVLMYLVRFTSNETINYLDLVEEKNAFLSHWSRIQSASVVNRAMYEETGRVVLESVSEKIKEEIVKYIQYNNQ